MSVTMRFDTNHRRRNIVAISIVMLALMMYALIPFARAQSSNNLDVFTTDSKPYGLTYGEWTARWWQWANSIPKPDNPAVDNTGKNCAIDQNGPVWFLAGTFGGSAERTCTIPSGKAILIPIFNSECSYAEFPALKSESDLRSCAKSLQDKTTSLEAIVDGMNIQGLEKYRVASPLFNLTFPENNVAGVSPGLTQGVSDGNWLFLKPLPPGKHEIHFAGASVDIATTSTNNFATAATYHVTVNP
jgi:hypothetical protein